MPLIDCMVMDEHRLDLDRSEKSVIFDIAVVDVECDEGVLGCNIAAQK